MKQVLQKTFSSGVVGDEPTFREKRTLEAASDMAVRLQALDVCILFSVAEPRDSKCPQCLF